MISVDFDKLEDINQVLNMELNSLKDILRKTKKEACRWNFKPQQELRCRSVRNLIDGSSNFNRKCNNTISEISNLINLIRQEIFSYNNAENQIVKSINKIGESKAVDLKSLFNNLSVNNDSTSSTDGINLDNYDPQKNIVNTQFVSPFLSGTLIGIDENSIGESKQANWWDTFWEDTTPLSEYQILGHKIPIIPSTSDLISGELTKNSNNLLFESDVLAYALSGLGLSLFGTVAGNSDRITKDIMMGADKDGVITQIYNDKFHPTTTPYSGLAKVAGTAAKTLTIASLAIDVGNTWTADSGNTNAQRLEKTGIQIGGGVICYGAGKVSEGLAEAGFDGIPETAGASLWLVGGAGALDVSTASGVTWGEDWLYNKLGIK